MRELVDLVVAHGAKPGHFQPLFAAWLAGKTPSLDGRHMRAPQRLHDALPLIEARLARLGRVVSEHPSSDGSCRMLVELESGATVESVLLARGGLCVSTQVGCAVGCKFCKTGESGLLRQLSSAEILAQVALGRARQPVRRVVFMGMGEPAHNLDNVLEALTWLGGAGHFAHKSIVFSTVGDLRAFERLATHDVRPALALSLHTTKDELRNELMPRAPRIPIRELVELACAYSDRVTWPLQVQWTLLDGINDGDDEVAGLLELFRDRRAIVNFIPYNHVDGYEFKRPDIMRAVEMVRALKPNGVFATIRQSGGQDVDGACGQLRARSAV